MLIVGGNVIAQNNLTDASEQFILKEQKEQAEKEISYYQFQIQGKIIDEDERPLNQVEVKIEKVISLGLLGNKRSVEEKLLDHNFQINVTQCNLIHLNFMKDGFYPLSKSFVISDFKKDSTGLFFLNNLKIKMVKLEVPYKSKRDYFILKYTPEISRTFFIPPHLPNGNSSGKVSGIDTLNNIPPHCFYLDVVYNNNGKSLTFNTKGQEVPVEFKLCIKNVDASSQKDPDGFIICPEIHDAKEMKKAPLTGYSSKVIFSPLSENGFVGNIFFYYRVNGYFGKGYISNAGRHMDGTFHIMIYYRQNIESVSPHNRLMGGKIN